MKLQTVTYTAGALLAFVAVSYSASIDISKLQSLRSSGVAAGAVKDGEYDQFVDKVYRNLAENMGGDQILSSMSGTGRSIQSFSEIDRSIDEKTYVLGTNDELIIYIWGSISEELSAVIDNEGSLIIPSVGTVVIGGKTLAEAKDLVKRKVLEVYRDVEITIVLGQIRKFRAYVLGEVQNPGGYTVTGATRVSDLIEMAGGAVRSDSCRMRGIEIVNEGRPMRYADMVLFYQNNDMRFNPYLSEGDRVFVRRRRDIVSVSGEVTYQGTYDFIAGDRVGTLIEAAGGLRGNADSSRIILTRFTDNEDGLETKAMSIAEAAVYVLARDDRILVSRLAEFRRHRNVWVTGEVVYPGRYPVSKDKTRLREVIEMAGGFTDEALLDQSQLMRKRRFMNRHDEFEVLEGVSMSSLTPLEKGYMKAKYIGKDGMFSVDFPRLFEKSEDIYNIMVMDGDSIVISRKNMAVAVNGAVIMPGLVTYKDGAEAKYYINQAGGYNSRAKKIQTVIIRGNSGVWLRPSDAGEIHEGDIILVPEREYKEFTKVMRDVLVVLSSIAAVVTAYIAVSQAIK
jgi:protein involved in polysaccharide export with SLBB domain